MSARSLRLRVPEREFERSVVDLAHLNGWKCVHFRPALTSDGKWRTPLAYDSRGWPDLVCVRDRLVIAELKAEGGAVRPEQREWIKRLQVAQVETYVWSPACWDEIVETFTRGDTP